MTTWQPVEDGMYGFGNLWPTVVTVYGANLEMSNEAVTFPDDIRLCERVPDNDAPPAWSYEGPATVYFSGAGLLTLRLDAPGIKGLPDRGVYTIRLELLEVNDE